MSVFEAGMLLCFGMAWPVNIYKSIKSRSTGGKSPVFLIIVFVGYISGITHKLLYSRDIVLILYILNAIMVTIDAALYYRNKKYEAEVAKSTEPNLNNGEMAQNVLDNTEEKTVEA